MTGSNLTLAPHQFPYQNIPIVYIVTTMQVHNCSHLSLTTIVSFWQSQHYIFHIAEVREEKGLALL